MNTIQAGNPARQMGEEVIAKETTERIRGSDVLLKKSKKKRKSNKNERFHNRNGEKGSQKRIFASSHEKADEGEKGNELSSPMNETSDPRPAGPSCTREQGSRYGKRKTRLSYKVKLEVQYRGHQTTRCGFDRRRVETLTEGAMSKATFEEEIRGREDLRLREDHRGLLIWRPGVPGLWPGKGNIGG